MNYVTPDLLQRFGSQDDRIADAADAEFESVAARYRGDLRKLMPRLPAGMRELQKKFYLHDAFAYPLKADKREFMVKLKLDTPPHEELLLRYKLAKKPKLERHPGLAEKECPFLIWLYDEVEAVKGRPSQFYHSILLNNGFEIGLAFTDLELTLLDSGNPDASLWTKKLKRMMKQSA